MGVGLKCRSIPKSRSSIKIMENQMEKNMENDMETEVI